MMEDRSLQVFDEVSPETISEAVIDTAIMNPKAMSQLSKVAKTFSMSTMVPPDYRNNVANCFVACEMAARMNLSPTFVMQNLFIVNGRPAWSGQACIALITGCGLFERGSLDYVYVGEIGTPGRGCYVQAVRRNNGKTVKGTVVSMQLAQDEGWVNKSGSKWKTMPEQMLKYRAAAFFARTECPNILMGFQLAEEVEDVHGTASQNKKTITINQEEQ